MGRKQVISKFSGMTIDMDYMLCIPSIHAIYGEEEAVIDYGGEIRSRSSRFPEAKIKLLKRWIAKHRKEIEKNHQKCGHNDFPLDPIKPLKLILKD